jgi:hypothetical protein
LARQLRQAIPCRPARRNFDHRRNRKLSRQSANEQVAADALVPKRCRSPASGSLRGLQWNARLRIGPSVSATCQPERAVSQRGMIPPFSYVDGPAWATLLSVTFCVSLQSRRIRVPMPASLGMQIDACTRDSPSTDRDGYPQHPHLASRFRFPCSHNVWEVGAGKPIKNRALGFIRKRDPARRTLVAKVTTMKRGEKRDRR